MRTKLFSKLATVWLFVLISLIVNITTACGHDSDLSYATTTAVRVNSASECPINVTCKTKGN